MVVSVLTIGVDAVMGTEEDDVFLADPGGLTYGDTIDGKEGINTIQLASAGTMDITQPDTFNNIQKLLGSAGDDVFVLSMDHLAGITNIDGGAGNNIIQMKDPNLDLSTVTLANIQKIFGTNMNDTITASKSVDTLYGGMGDDVYYVKGTDKIVEKALEGVDLVYTKDSYTLSDNVEKLTLIGWDDVDGTGNAQDNVLTGNGGDNVLRGLAGNDTLIAQQNLDLHFSGSDVNFTGSDVLIGGAGDDTYRVSGTQDIIDEQSDGGSGKDTVISYVSYSLSGPNIKGDVENLTLVGLDDSVGYGNALDNRITGNDGNNILYGLDGNDELYGGNGSNVLYGGNGNDIYHVTTTNDFVNEVGSTGVDTIAYDGIGTFSLIGPNIVGDVENLDLSGGIADGGGGNYLDNIITGNGRDNTLAGYGGNDKLYGGEGNDTLYGGDGNDELYGGTGADTMIGGLGNDNYGVDNAGDIVDERSGHGTDTVLALISFSLSDMAHVKGEVENLTLEKVAGAAVATGNALGNVLTGNDSNNTLNGLEGDDTLRGGKGADLMVGGKGNDTYYVENTGDVVDESSGKASDKDTVLSAISFSLADQAHVKGNVENLTLTGTDAINGTGNDLDNILIGNSAKNTLVGGGGSDTLIGGLGSDTLTGGAGKDFFVFNTAINKANLTIITDFNVTDDRIELTSSIYKYLGNASETVLSAAFVISSSGATSTRTHLIYDSKSGALFYDQDGSGSIAAIQIAKLAAGLKMVASDFMLI